jgi:diguanylate cyclase (GGDEF)-like protein
MTSGADSIRSGVQIQSIVPQDELDRKKAAIDKNEPYEYFPTDYIVSFSADSDHNEEYARNVLDSILKNYFTMYGEQHTNQRMVTNNQMNEADNQYDYIERAEILDSWTTDITNYMAAKKREAPDFRSAKTGYSFSDLSDIYKSYQSYDIPEIYALILEQEVSVDRDTLIKKYSNDISDFDIQINQLNENISKSKELIDSYSDKNREGMQMHYGQQADDGNSSTDYILKDVYEETEDFRLANETTYDTMILNYVELVAKRDTLQVDKEHTQQLLNIFMSGSDGVAKSNTGTIEENIQKLSSKLDDMFINVQNTVDEYNQYIGAANVSTLASINVEQKINIQIYLILAIIIFLFFGCVGAIILGRSEDFVEYLLYTDRKTGLPNRSKCDALIEQYSEDKVKDDFSVLLIKIENLKIVNDREGRSAGDALLKEFGKITKRAIYGYGFVGYNGADQFIGLFEDCSYQRAEDFSEYLLELMDYYNAQNPAKRLDVSVSIAESTTEGIYDVRKLMGLAFRKGASQSAHKKTETNKR